MQEIRFACFERYQVALRLFQQESYPQQGTQSSARLDILGLTGPTNSDGAPSVGFWHVHSAKSMHQGTSICGTATAVHIASLV